MTVGVAEELSTIEPEEEKANATAEEIEKDKKSREPSLARIRVFFYLRQNPNTWHAVSDIAKATELPEQRVKSALKMVCHHPLVEERDESCGYFKLLRL